MATRAPRKEWLVHIPDFPGQLQNRLSKYDTHVAEVGPDVKASVVFMGGTVLSKQPAEGNTPDIIGSAVLLRAETEEEVKEWMRKDVYTRAGIWDIANAKIYPFQAALVVGL